MPSTHARLAVMFPDSEDVKKVKKLAIDFDTDASTFMRTAIKHFMSLPTEEIERILNMPDYQDSTN